MNNVTNTNSSIRAGGGDTNMGNYHVTPNQPGSSTNSYQYEFTCEENSRDCKKFYQYFSKDSKFISMADFDVVRFYNWFDTMRTQTRSLERAYYPGGSCHKFRFKKATCDGKLQTISITGCGPGKREQLYDIVRQLYGMTDFQMDSMQTPDGSLTQDSTKASNTIVTSDIPVEEVTIPEESGITSRLCNTEDMYEMPRITDRFEVIQSGTISNGAMAPVSLILPRDLFTKEKKTSVNLSLFRSFLYAELEIEIRVIVNAPRFGQGKLIISWFPDGADEVDKHYLDKRSMMQRPHVIIDMNVTNQATITVPQHYRRTFIRNKQHETSNPGQEYGNFCTFQMCTFADYKTGQGQPTTLPYEILYRFTKAQFAGMSFGVDLQMDIVKEICPEVALAESLLRRTGFIGNQDKPYLEQVMNITPTPRKNFCSGNGVSDSIPLTFSRTSTVTTLTEYMNGTDPRSFEDLAKYWGYYSEFSWTTSNNNGDELWKRTVGPTTRTPASGATLRDRIPTPLDYASSQFAFWNGTIDLKFMIVSTPFHTGTLQFEISFGREASGLYDNASVYTKTFQLGEQREMELTIPYIYDTPWRMTQPYVSWPRTPGTDTSTLDSKLTANESSMFADAYPMSNQFNVKTTVVCRVLNSLTPIQNVSSTIDVIVLIKGGEDYQLRSVVPNFWTSIQKLENAESISVTGNNLYFRQFPVFDTTAWRSEVEPEYVVPRNKTSVGSKCFYGLKSTKNPKGKPGKMAQTIFQGEPTADFSRGIKLRHFHSTDDSLDFKTMMRRNVFFTNMRVAPLFSGNQILASYWNDGAGKMLDVKYDSSSRCWIPCYLPTHQVSSVNLPGPVGAPISTIPTLFRHWRGGLRYTLVFKNAKSPATVTYVPNMGTVLMGNQMQGHSMVGVTGRDETFNDYITLNRRISSLGFATELVIPSINPSVSINVPFDCMFNRCVTAQRLYKGDRSNAKRVITRDESTWISGHLVVESEEEAKFDVYISAGDDLNLMNFIGCTSYASSIPTGLSDQYTRGSNGVETVTFQMDEPDFRSFYSSKNITKSNFQMFGISEFLAEFTNTNKLARNSLRTITTTTINTTQKATDALTSIDKVAQNLDNKIDKSDKIVHDTASRVNKLVDSTETLINGITQHSDRVCEKTEKMVEKMGDFMDTTVGGANSVIDKSSEILDLLKPMVEKMNKLVLSMCPENINIVDQSKDFILDLIILVRSFDMTNFAIMFLKYITKLFTFNFELITTKADELVSILKRFVGVASTEQISGAKPATASMFGFFVSLVMIILNIKHSAKTGSFVDSKKEFVNFCFDKRSPNYVNSIVTLVERVFGAFGAAVNYLLGVKNVNQTVLEALQEKEADIAQFCIEVDEITDPANRKIMKRVDMKAKVWKNLMFARALKKKLVMCTGNSAANIILDYVRRMIKYCDEKWTSMANCPVRMEPRVYCFVGDSNIGKSFLVDQVAVGLLKPLGYKCVGANPVFTRAPGRKNWDGYDNQEIIRFDDYLNMMDPESVREQISDLYELKSTCEFLPPMADLSQKGDSGSPKGVILLCNRAFPTEALNGAVTYPDAVWRRRDKLIWTRRKTEYENVDLRTLSDDDSQNLVHLEFKFVDSVIGKDSVNARDYISRSEWMNFPDFMKILVDDFTAFHKQEMIFAKRRLDLFSSDLPDFVRELSDPMDLFNFRAFNALEQTTENPENLPSKLLEKQISECLMKLRENTALPAQEQSESPVVNGVLTDAEKIRLEKMLADSYAAYERNVNAFHTGKCNTCEMTINGEKHDINLCRLGQSNLLCLHCTNFGTDTMHYKFDPHCHHFVDINEGEQGGPSKYFDTHFISTRERKYPSEMQNRKQSSWLIRRVDDLDWSGRRELLETEGVTFRIDSYDSVEYSGTKFLQIIRAIDEGTMPFFFPFTVNVTLLPEKSYKRLADEYLYQKSLVDPRLRYHGVLEFKDHNLEYTNLADLLEQCKAAKMLERYGENYRVATVTIEDCPTVIMDDFIDYIEHLSKTDHDRVLSDLQNLENYSVTVERSSRMFDGDSFFLNYWSQFGLDHNNIFDCAKFSDDMANEKSFCRNYRTWLPVDAPRHPLPPLCVAEFYSGNGYYNGKLGGIPKYIRYRKITVRMPEQCKFRPLELKQLEYEENYQLPEEHVPDRQELFDIYRGKVIQKCKDEEADYIKEKGDVEIKSMRKELFIKHCLDDAYHHRAEVCGYGGYIIGKRPNAYEYIGESMTEAGLLREKMDDFATVMLDMGWDKHAVPPELLEYLLNSQCAASVYRCDHCERFSVFQWGTRQHHVCTSCWHNESVCDVCPMYKKEGENGRKRFWLDPFIALWTHCQTFLMEKYNGQHAESSSSMLWLMTIIKGMISIAYIYIIKELLDYFYIPRFFITSFAIFGVVVFKNYTHHSFTIFQQEESAIHFNEPNYGMMVNARQVYGKKVCQHQYLLDALNWDYGSGYWNVEGHKFSIFPCEKNCILFSGDNSELYHDRCKQWCEENQYLYNARFEACRGSAETLAEFMADLPPFMRTPVIEVPTTFNDKFEEVRRQKYRNMFNRFYNTLLQKLGMNPTWKWLKILGACGALLVSAVMTIKGLSGLYKWMCGDKQENQDQYDRAQMRHFKRPVQKPKLSKVVKQGDSEFVDALTNKMFKNTFSIVVLNNKQIVQEIPILGVQHRVGIMPRHYVRALREWSEHDVELEIRFPAYPNLHISYEFDEADYLESSTNDIALFYAPKTINEFRNIYPYFATQRDFKTPLPQKATLLKSMKSTDTIMKMIPITLYGMDKTQVERNGEMIQLDDMIKYNFSEPGACSSIVFRANSTRPIVGMHVAGTTKASWNTFGFAVPLCQEMFENEFISHKKTTANEYHDLEKDEFETKIAFGNQVEVQSLFAAEKAMHIPMKTKIRPSLMHMYDGEPKTRPCYLSSFEPGYKHELSPLVAGASKHGILTKNFPTSLLHEVRDALYEYKYSRMKPLITDPKVLTIGEAIRGFSVDGYEQLKLNTSMGYPYCLGDKKQKQDYITVTDEQENEKRQVFIDKEVLEHIQSVIKDKRAGIIRNLPVIDNVKDERKVHEKVEKEGSTRIYCMNPIANTISSRMNFLHFAAAYKANRLDLQHAVGIARDGPEWGVLVKKLLANSARIVTLDYKNFGPGYNAAVNALAHDIMTRWTLEHVLGANETELYVLGEEHYNSVHLAGDLVYRQLCGGPSGNDLTVVKNGIVNELYILLAFSILFDENIPEGTYSKYETYFALVVLFTFGDDAIMSIAETMVEWFNGETISELFSRYGIVATDAEKSGSIQKYKTIGQATFLKSGFAPHPYYSGEWLAPLDWVSITETPRWIESCEDEVAATKQNVEMALSLTYGHGKEKYNEFQNKIQIEARKAGVPATYLTWDELDARSFPLYNVKKTRFKLPDTLHEHICIKCDTKYEHTHGMINPKHKQHENQCPNQDCEWYHQGNNRTNSQKVN